MADLVLGIAIFLSFHIYLPFVDIKCQQMAQEYGEFLFFNKSRFFHVLLMVYAPPPHEINFHENE